jgi:HJR/Mrr/RecB family endonuclease
MIEPKFSDYGLTKEEVEKWVKFSPGFTTGLIFSVILSLILSAYWVFPLYNKGVSLFAVAGLTVISAIFVFPFIGLLIGSVVGLLVNYLYKKAYPNYSIYGRFSSDSKAYTRWEIKSQRSFWESLSGSRFEHEFANLLISHGYKARVTPHSNDKGIDIIASNHLGEFAIQCKRHKKRIGPNYVRELYGAMNASGYTKGILVCTGGFTSGAASEAKVTGILLWDIKDILRMQRED